MVIDGGNTHFKDDVRRARELASRQIHYLDVGTSGGVWGLERGYCLMIGGDRASVERLDPIFRDLAPGRATFRARRARDGRSSPAAPPNWATCTAVRPAPATSSR